MRDKIKNLIDEEDEKKPEAAPALVGLGRALAKRGKSEEAEKQLRKAVKLDAKTTSPIDANTISSRRLTKT